VHDAFGDRVEDWPRALEGGRVSPPAITSRSRVCAPSMPPLTGASSIITSFAASSVCTRRTSAGALVVWSM
jgi:hypothetical protein